MPNRGLDHNPVQGVSGVTINNSTDQCLWLVHEQKVDMDVRFVLVVEAYIYESQKCISKLNIYCLESTSIIISVNRICTNYPKLRLALYI